MITCVQRLLSKLREYWCAGQCVHRVIVSMYVGHGVHCIHGVTEITLWSLTRYNCNKFTRDALTLKKNIDALSTNVKTIDANL